MIGAHRAGLASRKEESLHSTNVRQIKAALVEQAFHGTTQVRCPWGQVVAVSRWKGQLRVMIRGWRRWYPVSGVTIERLVLFPTGACDLGG